jgi:hypothetical protein
MNKIKNISFLFFARSDGRPDTFAPAHAGIAARALRYSIFNVLVVVGVLLNYAVVACATTALPRIKVRTGTPVGEFYNSETGETFYPEGSNYVRLHWLGDDGFHSTFTDGMYSSVDAEASLTKMEQGGYNTVRVFCYKGHYKLTAEDIYAVNGPYSTDGPQLYQPYMDNIIDFLRRANAHGIYVYMEVGSTPWNSYYNSIANTGSSNIEGSINRELLAIGPIEAKKLYLRQFIQYIKNSDPNLLSTILSYEIRNEIRCDTEYKPFSMTSGWVFTADGNEYNMGSASSRQACQDNNINNWANQCVSVIRAEDADALASCSVFTFSVVGKSGLAGAGLLPLDMADNRWPARPLKLQQSSIDFIDIHCYLPWGWSDELASSEWANIDKMRQPFLVGEFGAHRVSYPDVNEAADLLYDYREDVYDLGFAGALLFTWDTYSHTRWTAMEEGEVVNNRLKPTARYSWDFQDNGLEGWELTNGIDSGIVSEDVLSLQFLGGDAYIHGPATRIDTSLFRYLRVRMKNHTSSNSAQVFWTTKSDTNWDESKSQSFQVTEGDSNIREFLVDLSDNPSWVGTVSQIRFDPVSNSIDSGSVEIDGIWLVRDSECVYADFNRNGAVDLSDFAVLAENWQHGSQMSWSEGDLNNDLTVDLSDMLFFSHCWLVSAGNR